MSRPPQTAESATLYVVATPIGNLGDITLRALEILGSADVIAAEDTRNSGSLLQAHGLSGKLLAVHEHNEQGAAEKIVGLLAQGQSVALVSDAGTPAVSDPGARVVARVRAAGYRVIPIPGPNAAIAAISAAGLEEPHFLFYGFLPAKAGARQRELQALRESPHALVFYESPHRIVECTADLLTVLGPQRQLTIAREITKLFETLHVCPLGEAPDWLAADANRQKGEFVLIVSGCPPQPDNELNAETRRILGVLLEELPVKQAAKLAAAITGAKKNALYEEALRMGGKS